MSKKRDTYEQAVTEYNTRYGKAPTVSEINAMYNTYAIDGYLVSIAPGRTFGHLVKSAI